MGLPVVSPERLLFSKKEAARLVGLSPRSIDYLIAHGVLETVKIRARRLIKASSLLALAENGTAKPAAAVQEAG